jgi:hypothetical protein
LIGFDFGPVTTNISDYGGGGGVNPTKRLQLQLKDVLTEIR